MITPLVVLLCFTFGCQQSEEVAEIESPDENLLWKFKAESQINSSPTIADGLIYFGCGESPKPSSRTEPYYFYALDAMTGQEKWRFETNEGVQSPPLVVNGVVYFGSMENCLYAVDAKTGEKKWKFKTNDAVMSSPVIFGNMVCFGSKDNYLYAIKIDHR
jgi:outer membrane protein assembly factor BamB